MPFPRTPRPSPRPIGWPERALRLAHGRSHLIPLLVVLAFAGTWTSARAGAPPRAAFSTVHGTVRDSASGQPLESAEIRFLRDGQAVGEACWTSALGRFVVTGLARGSYQCVVRRLDFRPFECAIAVADGDQALDVALTSAAVTLGGVSVTARPGAVAIDERSGNQVFQQDAFHGAPTATTSQIVQQALAGAARAPTSEVHIRGQHGEFTYYVDGVPVPPGISGSMSELFSPDIVEHIEFQTGGWDAEYGNRNSAVITVGTRVPTGGPRISVSDYAGSFGSTGQSLVASGNAGRLGVMCSGSAQSTGMRREPVMQDPLTHAPLNFHNSGDDLDGFGKLQYVLGTRDLVVLDASISRTAFEVPYDSTGGITSDDGQVEHNGFLNLGWHHARGAQPSAGEIFAGLYHRWSRLSYLPGEDERPTFVFYPDTVPYEVREDRAADITGLRLDALLPATGAVQFKSGFDVSRVSGHEHFATRDARQIAGPAVDADVSGGDAGGYLQASIRPERWWELRPGLRYDAHQAPLAGTATQWSPRVRLNFFPGPRTSAWLYYGRLFVPSPAEDFHVLASAGQGGQVGLPTRPERDHFVEACLVQQLPSRGTTVKLDAYHKQSGPAVDDNTLPGTALSATVDVAQVRVSGIEAVVDVHPGGAVGGYVNAALGHAAAHGPITGGFSPTAYPGGWYDLDHDQRLSVVGNLSFDRRRWFASATGIYGSGLTNGHPDAAPNGLGLLDFNRGVKVPPSFIVNVGCGGSVRIMGLSVRPQAFVDNAFDRRYVLKGAFTSGPSIGRPRAIVVRIDVANRPS